MLLSDFLKKGQQALGTLYPGEEVRSILALLCEEMLGVGRYMHLINPGYEIPAGKLPEMDAALERLGRGEPIQYIIGSARFCGRDFYVNDAVLIPRPETELLCREAIALCEERETPSILDLCTGSGNIAWTMALSLEESRVVGVDVSPEALAVASSQPFTAALQDGRHNAPVFVQADILSGPSLPEDSRFDLILSNPPYIRDSEKSMMRRNVLDYEPALALFVPDTDPLRFYRAVALWSVQYLAPGGVGLTEINEDLSLTTKIVFESFGFSKTLIIKDMYGKDRFVRYAR